VARVAAKKRYDAMSAEERRKMVARRDKEKVRRRDRARQTGNPKHVARVKAYQQTPKGRAKLNEANRRWRKLNQEKVRAHSAVARAIRSGDLVRPETCQIEGCPRKPQAHHADYSRPLDVTWLCARHHSDTHTAERGLSR
jgi:hypothetical protein